MLSSKQPYRSPEPEQDKFGHILEYSIGLCPSQPQTSGLIIKLSRARTPYMPFLGTRILRDIAGPEPRKDADPRATDYSSNVYDQRVDLHLVDRCSSNAMQHFLHERSYKARTFAKRFS